MHDNSVDIWNNLSLKNTFDNLQKEMFVNNEPTKMSFVSEQKFENILDFGCGLGRNSSYLKKISNNVDGYDVPNVINKINPKLYNRLYSNFDLVCKNKYDLIVSYFVFQFFHDVDYLNYVINKLSKISQYLYVYSRSYMEDIERTNIFNAMYVNVNTKILNSIPSPCDASIQKYPDETHFEAIYKCVNKNNPLIINCDNNGYGDIITLSWILEGSKKIDTKIFANAKNEKRKLLELLGQEIHNINYNCINLSYTFPHDQYEIYNNKVSRLESWIRFFELYDIEPKRPPLLLEQKDFDAVDKYCKGDTIILCPDCIRPHRTWPPIYWVQLMNMLNKRNFNTLILCKNNKFFSQYPNYIENFTWRKTAALFTKAKLVIGNDSAPTHMAGITETPAIAILGPTTPEVFTHLSNVQCITADPKTIPCVGCWFNENYKYAPCEQACMALSNITPKQVYKKVLRIL